MLLFAHGIQGLLESSAQTIFTTVLMTLSYVDTPEKESEDDEYVWTNAFSSSISFSFVPMLSVACGILSIIINSGRAIKIIEICMSVTKSQKCSWIFFIISTALFRIQVGTLLPEEGRWVMMVVVWFEEF